MPSTDTVQTRTAAPGRYQASIADTPEQVRKAQRLRYQVFSHEIGATLHTNRVNHDADELDELADHLIVTEAETDDVVGTYRLLPPGRTEKLYSDDEFDTRSLDELRPNLLEAGRSCVHPNHRSGAVINLMWSAVARYALLAGQRYLAGCASVPLTDGGHSATNVWQLAATKHASPADLRVRPLQPWLPTEPFSGNPSYAQLPPLLRGYLRLGAWVCGPPAHDPDFGVADFFVLLPLAEANPRYVRYLVGEKR